MPNNTKLPRSLDLLKSLPFYVLPHHTLSRGILALTRIRAPWFKNRLINWFSKQFKVDWSESHYQRSEDFEHFNAFFTRKLRKDARPIETGSHLLTSPADGYVSQAGDIDNQQIIQAKGHRFSVQTLLGGNKLLAQKFQNGKFATLYLSPKNYHRVHMPCTGVLRKTIYIPGRLFSVAPHTTRSIPGLFARNERLVAIFDTEHGEMAMILVGALFVAAIETTWSGLETPPHRNDIELSECGHLNITLQRGSEMGRFNMGSTVILLFENNRIEWHKSLIPGQPLKMGQQIGGPG